MDLLTLPGVFAPISDSRLLAAAVAREPLPPGAPTLDLCTGGGIVALAAARLGATATAVDVSRRALWTVRLNARRHGLSVRTRRGHLFEPVADERFDLVTANPPYVPSPAPTVPTRGSSRAWEAGHDGRLALDPICDQVGAVLRPGGAVLLVHSSLIGEGRTLDRLRGAGLVDVEVVERHRGRLGPLMRAQQQTGLVDPDLDEEDVVVIRGVAPRAR